MANALLLCREDYEGGSTLDSASGQIPSAAREVYEIMCVTKGWAEYWVEDQHYKLKAGDILLVPAGAMVGANLKQRGCPFAKHAIWMSRRYMTFLKLQDDEADYLFSNASKNHAFVLTLAKENFDELSHSFEAFAAECQNKAINKELSAKALLSCLITEINRFIFDGITLSKGSDNRLSAVITHIHENCTSPLTVDALAVMFDYSSSHLAHSFKKQTGTSLYHYILMRRLQIGREAMLSGVPVKEAYQKCGFGDYAGFYRAFTKEFGISPQQYKKRNQ